MVSSGNILRCKFVLTIIPYFFWYQSMKLFFGYSARAADCPPLLAALLFSLALAAGIAAWALYFNHRMERPVKTPVIMSALTAAVLTALLTSFPGVLPVFLMCGAAFASAALPVSAFLFMYNNLPEKEFGLLTCLALALPTVVLFMTLEFVSTGLPLLVPNLNIYFVLRWMSSLSVCAGGLMTLVLPAAAADKNKKSPALQTNSASPAVILTLAVLVCLLFSCVTAGQYNMTAETIDSGHVYEELFLVAVFVAAGMLCDLKGWHIAMYASVLFILAALVGLLFSFDTSGVALSNAGSAAFDAAFLFMFMDIAVRFKNAAFLFPLGFALPSLLTYAAFLLNILTGQRSDLPVLIIISVFAAALLPLIALLAKSLPTLSIQGSAERKTVGGCIELKTLASVKELTERYTLTPKEAEVLQYTLAGQSAKEMAQNLCITQRTARAHIGSILRKVGVKNRLQLVSTLLSDNNKQ